MVQFQHHDLVAAIAAMGEDWLWTRQGGNGAETPIRGIYEVRRQDTQLESGVVKHAGEFLTVVKADVAIDSGDRMTRVATRKSYTATLEPDEADGFLEIKLIEV